MLGVQGSSLNRQLIAFTEIDAKIRKDWNKLYGRRRPVNIIIDTYNIV